MDSQGGHGAASKDELDPDEPRTPLWLPLLGLCLLFGAVIYALTGKEPEPTKPEAVPSASASAAPAPTPPT